MIAGRGAGTRAVARGVFRGAGVVGRFVAGLPSSVRFGAACVAAILVASVGAVSASAFADTDPCVNPVNPIVCENSKDGTPESQWQIADTGDPTIQGFSTDISVNVGQTIGFKVKTDATSYELNIYRLGWYGGDGARYITTVNPSAVLPQNQPACITDPATEIYDCGNWAVSASWPVPASSVSGVYIAQLKRKDNGGTAGGESHIPFVVRNDASTSKLFFQTSDTTWQAYNTYGGSSFYEGAANGRAYKLSYNRPFATRSVFGGRDFLFSNEYPMIRFLEQNGYDLSYTSGLDSDRRGDLIKNHKTFLSVGHDEYWSGNQRANVEAARDAGVNLAFFSGNEVYWKTRWESSQDGSNTANRTLVCYKETWANSKIDPTSEWTGTWRDPRFTPPSNGNRPENELTGTAYTVNLIDLPIRVSQAEGKLRLWRGTSLANMTSASADLAPHTVGYESDEDLDNGHRPAGLIHMSTSTGTTNSYLLDFGNQVGPADTTHHVTMYKAASGALVFSAGTIQWAWGLDSRHDGYANEPADERMQQATVNLLADMGAQPATRMANLDSASPSADTQAPTVTFSSPAAGTAMASGAQVTVSGTASDVGGRVAAVEVSTDGGTTYHPATGTTSWSYSFYAAGQGSVTVKVRASDDSANVGVAVSRQFVVNGPHSIFGNRVPKTPAAYDGGGLELGVRISPQANGIITGIRFYKGDGNTGTHTGSLWSNSGTRLATGTFGGESSSGWQTMTFTTPVAVTAGNVYVASYYAPNGHYAADPWAFSTADVVASPLLAKRSTPAARNGLFRAGPGFPEGSFEDTNYYVDVLFQLSGQSSPYVTGTTPTSGEPDVALSARPTATFSEAVNPATVAFTVKTAANVTVSGTTAYDATSRTATFTPTTALPADTTFNLSVQASGSTGVPMPAAYTWSFASDADPNTSTLLPTTLTPAVPAANDSYGVELGTKFVPAVDGAVAGLRFYQGPGSTGTKIGSLWSSTGALMARVTFPTTTATGWQTASFTTPIAVVAGSQYVVSYWAPNGGYSYTSGFFATPWTNGQLTAPSGDNGLFHYGGNAYPTNSWNSTNYFVDPLFVAGGNGGGGLPPDPVNLLGNATPSWESYPDNNGVELGLKFRPSVGGTVTAVRFYKGAQNTGVHVGSVWSATGQLLGSATFSNETASGWQTVTLSPPVPVVANTTYVVSYYAPNGNYAVNGGAFTADFVRGPLTAPTGNNGVFKYQGSSTFPTDSWNSSNYWVDVTFQAAA